MTINDILTHLNGVTGHDGQYTAKCPAHDDNKGSLSVSEGRDGRVLIHCHAGCSTVDILNSLGLKMKDLYTNAPVETADSYGKNASSIEDEYIYYDAVHNPVLKKVRMRNPDGSKRFYWQQCVNGEWINGRGGIDPPLYMGHADVIGDAIYVVEGEKDVLTLEKLGFSAVSLADGARSKWLSAYSDVLCGKTVLIIPDNDEPGHTYAEYIMSNVVRVAHEVRILDLVSIWAAVPEHGDVSDMVDRLGTDAVREQLTEQINAASVARCKNSERPMGMTVINALELQNMDLRPLHFVVSEMLSTGLAAVVAQPKHGKSFWALQLCIAVASGADFLGFSTEQGDCLYLALEDQESRLKERMNKQLHGQEAPPGLNFAVNAKTLDAGLIDDLASYITRSPKTRLVVIDTLQMVRGRSMPGESAYQADYRTMTQLKTFADEHDICVLVVHHLRKMGDDGDPFNRISGTNGLFGALDTAVLLTKDSRDNQDATMSITGRDIAAKDLVIRFDESTCCWNLRGDAQALDEKKQRDEYDKDPLVATIKGLLQQSADGRWVGFAKDILDAGSFVSGVYSSQRVGKELLRLEPLLYEYDGIIHSTISNGTGGKRHSFCYKNVPTLVEFTDLDDDDDLLSELPLEWTVV